MASTYDDYMTELESDRNQELAEVDEYIKDIDSKEKDEIADAEELYGNMSKDYEGKIDEQIKGVDDWEKKQIDIQNKNTDFAIEQIEQQKEYAHKDYVKEQTAAYADYEKQVDPYGVNAERIAANGLSSSGYSESSKVSMYKSYQNRVSVARETFQRACIEFGNAITQARLQNDAAIAEIAYNTFQARLELTLNKLQTKNSLLLELADKKFSINSTYNNLRLGALGHKASINSAYNSNYLDAIGKKAEEEMYNDLKISPDSEDEGEEGGWSGENIDLNRKLSVAESYKYLKQSLDKVGGKFAAIAEARNANEGTTVSSSGKKTMAGTSENSSVVTTTNEVKQLSTKQITDLGYGVISEDFLAFLVSTGRVIYSEKNGTVKNANGRKPTKTEVQAAWNAYQSSNTRSVRPYGM